MKGKGNKNNNGENALRMRAGYFFYKKNIKKTEKRIILLEICEKVCYNDVATF